MHGRTNEPEIAMRRARPDEAEALSALALRSKASWGYDAAFMESVRSALTFSPEYIADCPVYLLERENAVLGVFGIQVIDNEPYLHDFWIDPSVHGRGFGFGLFVHALLAGHAAGHAYVLIESDPNAEGFYLHCGARRIGTHTSSATGRPLPLLRIATLDPEA